MKNLIILFILVSLFTSCGEMEKEPLDNDTVAPSNVISHEITNLPGGALITYTLPDETDLLYVEAEYTLTNGEKYVSKSSIFINMISIEGFGDTLPHDVKLYVVDRSENRSEPLTITIQPEQPSVKTVKETVEMTADFGGVLFTWENPDNAPLAFFILAEDSTGVVSPIETVYSAISDGKYALRGFDPSERKFGVVVQDKWKNTSDTLEQMITPLFEQKLDKKLYSSLSLPGDANMNAWEGKSAYAWDDDVTTFNHSAAGTGWPQYFTIDLGVMARLSRVNILQRQGEERFYYGHGNPRLFEVWGTAEQPSTVGEPSFEGWVKLKDCVSIKPSEQGGTADEDLQHLKDGDDFSFTIEDPSVRYIRILVNETWGNTGFIHFAEVEFWGQIITE
jgi:hypothetical protein